KWQDLTANVRSVFSGKIIYRKNWWITADWAEDTALDYYAKLNNPIFEHFDVIAIASYFELTDKPSPTKGDIENALYSTDIYNRGQNIVEEVYGFYERWRKPIFFGELGITPYSLAP